MFEGDSRAAVTSPVGHVNVGPICICLCVGDEKVDVSHTVCSYTSSDSSGVGNMCIWVKLHIN